MHSSRISSVTIFALNRLASMDYDHPSGLLECVYNVYICLIAFIKVFIAFQLNRYSQFKQNVVRFSVVFSSNKNVFSSAKA